VNKMYQVLLVCQGGMSSSFIVKKIKLAFKNHNEQIEIHAYAGIELEDHIEAVDMVLVAPNILYMWDDIASSCKDHGIEPVIIPFEHYGNMDGEAIRDLILSINQ